MQTKLAIVLGIAGALAGASLFVARPPIIAALDQKTIDFVTRPVPHGAPDGSVIIVDINEASLVRHGHWPWPRPLMGRLVKSLLDEGAATVVLDMMFPASAGDPVRAAAEDGELAGMLAGKPTVVGFFLQFQREDGTHQTCTLPSFPLVVASPGGGLLQGFPEASGALCNAPAISMSAAAAGFLNAAPDRDANFRRAPLVMEFNGQYHPSLGLAAVFVYRGARPVQLRTGSGAGNSLRLADSVIPLEGEGFLRLRFRGKRGTFPYVGAAEFLDGRAPAGRLRGAIAIVGSSAPGLEVTVSTPVDPLLPGVELQATVIDNLLRGDALSRPADAMGWELFSAIAIGLGAAFLSMVTGPIWAVVGAAALIGGAWVGSVLLVNMSGWVLSPLPVTATVLSNYLVFAATHYLRQKRRADRTVRELAQMEESAKEALRESEFRYKRLVENINDAIVVDDLDGRIVFANPRFLEWFGISESELANVTLERIAAPEWKQAVREYHDRRVRGESAPERFEYEAIRADGARMWMEALVTTVERDGRVRGTQSALRDMTERRRIEEQSLHAQRLESVGRLAGGVAHDFNNLLTVILGYSATLLEETGPAKAQREALEQIRLAAERAADLTQNLLAFSRQQVVKHRAVNVNLVVVEAEKMFGRLVGADVELVLKLSWDLGMVMADAGRLQQVLMNIVVNARDSMPGVGVLRIETKNLIVDEAVAEEHPWAPPGEYVYLSLSDTGTGMSEDVQQKVFEPFFTTKEPGKGTGLGLATAYGIVRQCGGWIGVRSRVGAGTTFHVYLPRIAGAAAASIPARQAVVATRGWETVLLVEDQDAVRQITAEMLKNSGYVVLAANGGPEAIALAGGYTGAIHVLVTDAVMPKMSGRELARILKAKRPEMRVVIVSGYTDTATTEAIDDGFEFLQKPFTPEVLAGKLRGVLES